MIGEPFAILLSGIIYRSIAKLRMLLTIPYGLQQTFCKTPILIIIIVGNSLDCSVDCSEIRVSQLTMHNISLEEMGLLYEF